LLHTYTRKVGILGWQKLCSAISLRQRPAKCDVATMVGFIYVFVTNCGCFSAAGLCVWAKLNYYGSWNDGEMSRSFRDKLKKTIKNVDDHGVVS